MIVNPKKGFGSLVKVLDAINPVMVLLSIIGLFMEYTGLRSYVLLPNMIISIVFAVDFLLRLIAFPAGKYFFKGYGWVDFLASLPGFMVLVANTPILAVFKVVRIGRFFRIIRILRFLRAFDFMKRMRGDSAWIQERVMQTGVAIVLIFVGGIIFTDQALSSQHVQLNQQRAELAWQNAGRNTARMAASFADAELYFLEGRIYQPGTGAPVDAAEYLARSGDMDGLQLVAFSDVSISPQPGLNYPEEGLLMRTAQTTAWYNQVMLGVLGTLLLILCAIIFYMGYVFAKDMSVVQLIIDSLDAEDYMLLANEADRLRNADGAIELHPEEDEISSLLKMAAKLGSQLANQPQGASSLPGGLAQDGFGPAGLSGMPGLSGLAGMSGVSSFDEGAGSPDAAAVQELTSRLDRLEQAVRDSQKVIALKTIKLATPVIIRYIQEELARKAGS
ncbi:MAG: ion transporter [Spirochaetes bacterium]|nr:ion transporter [Spirochaetota bacterium]